MIHARTLAIALALSAAPLLAQAPAAAPAATPAAAPAAKANPALVVGATIKDTKGNAVGTIDAVEANGIIVNTGTHQIAIPATSFGNDKGTPLLAATKAELNAAAQAAAEEERKAVLATLQHGAPVVDAVGSPLGTVDIIEGEMVLLKTEAGEAQVPVKSLRMRGDSLAIAMTAEAFTNAVEAARSGS
jgi:hypothetical protein